MVLSLVSTQTREEMKKLASLKPMTGLFAKAQEDLKSSEGTREQIMGRLKACDEKISGFKERTPALNICSPL